jgi:hypothetical protein
MVLFQVQRLHSVGYDGKMIMNRQCEQIWEEAAVGCLKDRKITKILRTLCNPAGIRTVYIPNINPESFRYTNLLG